MQLASKLVLALLVTDSCRPHPLTFGNWGNIFNSVTYRKQGILSGWPKQKKKWQDASTLHGCEAKELPR